MKGRVNGVPLLGTVDWSGGAGKDKALTPARDKEVWASTEDEHRPGAGCDPHSRRTLATARRNACRRGLSAAEAEPGRRGGA